MTKIKKWTFWTQKVYGITMEITQVWRGYVNLWDTTMLMRWKGSTAQFLRDFREAE